MNDPHDNPVEHLSLRGKNVFFLERVADALQLDRIGPPDLVKFKEAFTPAAVRKIAEAVLITWPNDDDLRRALREERGNTSALYTGTYSPDAIRRGVTRHSLYADTILLPDPLIYPHHVRPEFNPIENPDQHRSSFLRWVTLWFAMSPWIEAGIVKFVRTPGDFDAALDLHLMNQARARVEQDPELKAIQNAFVESEGDAITASYRRQIRLGYPDDYIRQLLRKKAPRPSEAIIESVIQYVHKQRAADPYFIDTIDNIKGGELLQVTTGANYDMAKLTAILAGAHIITDLEVRWKELEVDKESVGFDPKAWVPFAKAFSGISWRFLENVPLDEAFRLRKEERLENMRSFLRRTWRASSPDQSYEPSAAEDLTAELNDRIREAESEWNQIDRDLLKWSGSELAAAALGLGPAVAQGAGQWAAGGIIAAAGVTNLIISTKKRADWETTFPAGFLLRLKQRGTRSASD